MRPIERQTILITGSTDGLGLALARELARRGAGVIVHGRDEAKCDAVASELARGRGPDRVQRYVADLSSLDEVRRLATEVEQANDQLHALVNNAGIALRDGERQVSRDGHELTFAVNYLSHFMLTLSLLPLLRRSEPARIVNVASVSQAPIDFDDPMLERGYEPFRAYSQSKLAQISSTFELAARLDPSQVTVNALHPATLMDTKMVRDAFRRARSSVEEGMQAALHLIAAPELDGVSGRYFDGRRESSAHRQAYDPHARRRLWQLSERLCGLA